MLRARKNGDLFRKYGVLNKAEYESRIHIAIEKYVKQLAIEAETMVSMAQGQILPAALEHQRRMAEAVTATKAAGVEPGETAPALREFVGLVDQFRSRTAEVERLAATTRPTRRGTRRRSAGELKPAMARTAGDGGRDREPGGGRRSGRCRRTGPAVPEVTERGVDGAERQRRGPCSGMAPFAVAQGDDCARPLHRPPAGRSRVSTNSSDGHRAGVSTPAIAWNAMALFRRGVGIEVDCEGFDEAGAIGAGQRVQPGLRVGEPAALQPDPDGAIQPAGQPAQLFQHRLASAGGSRPAV